MAHTAATEIASDNGQESMSLLDLPPELRNQIYEHVLAQDGDQVCEIQDRLPFIEEPALLFTNKQVRNETTLLFYGQNTFYTDIKTLGRFVKFSRRERLPLFRSIHAFSKWDLKRITLRSHSLIIRHEYNNGSKVLTWAEFQLAVCNHDIYECGKQLALFAAVNGVPRTAILLPIYGTDVEDIWRERWISVGEYRSFMDAKAEGERRKRGIASLYPGRNKGGDTMQ